MTSLALSRGDSLTTWELSPTRAIPFAGEAAPAHDPQDYKYINGFVDVGDLPCRIATWRDVATRQVELETDWPVESLYLSGTTRRVDFSQFRYTPTRLARWCRTRLVAPVDRYCSFRLETCGGIHIWVDGVLAARFEPFTRNRPQQTIVHLPIRAAGSEMIVFTEEMAERDTTWSFELELIDDVSLTVAMPSLAPGGGASLLETLAAEVRPRDEVSGGDGTIALQFDTSPPVPVAMHVRIEGVSHAARLLLSRDLTLPAGGTIIDVCAAAELPDGYYEMHIGFDHEGVQLDRTIACVVLHQPQPLDLGPDLATRKRRALEYAAAHGELRMGTVLALAELGRADDPRVAPILDATLRAIEERHDCADFVAVPLLWLWQRHAGVLSPDMRERIRKALVGFRYWVDEPGNDVMWFWSENHALCFHTAQLLAGLSFPLSTFTASGRSGQDQARLATERLERWFASVEDHGLAEWNSSAYYPVDFIGLLALAELAPEPIAARARGLCDRIFAMVALHTLGAVPAGSMGRAYNGSLWTGPLSELAPFMAVAYGRGWLNPGVTSLPMFAAGRYAPPDEYADWMEPATGSQITASYLQGYGPAAALTVFKTRHLQLSSNALSAAGQPGHQQHLLDVRFAALPIARSWINHPGEADPWGQHRPGFWAGNGVLPRVGQSGGIALVTYRLGAARQDFTHACVTRSGILHHLDGDTLILVSGEGLLGYKATGPIVPVTTGPGAGVEYRLFARNQGWAAIAAEDGSDFHSFAELLRDASLVLEGEGARLTLRCPNRPVMVLDWETGLFVDGDPCDLPIETTPHPRISLT